MSEIHLLQGDCLEVMRTVADSSVDLILTDPPYYKVKGDYWDRQWDTAQGFLDWLDLVLEQYYRILKPNGSLYMFASPQMSDRVSVRVRERFNVLNHIIWVKDENGTRRHEAQLVDKGLARSYYPDNERLIFAEHYGADGYAKGEAGYSAKVDELRGFIFEPIRKYLDDERKRAGIRTEDIGREWMAWKGRESKWITRLAGHWFEQTQWSLPTAENYQWLRETLSRLNHGGEYLKREYEDLKQEYEDLKQEYEGLRRPFSVTADVPYTDVWTFKTVSAYPRKHPCEKPPEMLEHIIRTSSKPGAVVLDSFMGTGNTGKAALKLGRSFTGIERDAKYFKAAEDRIMQSQMEMPL